MKRYFFMDAPLDAMTREQLLEALETLAKLIAEEGSFKTVQYLLKIQRDRRKK